MRIGGAATSLAIAVAAHGVYVFAANLPSGDVMTLAGVAIGLMVDDAAYRPASNGNAPAVLSKDGVERSMFLPAKEGEASSERRRMYLANDAVPKVFERIVPATHAALNARGISNHIALVQVEVNGGGGSALLPLGESFVATAIRKVDGTNDYPLNAERVAQSIVEQCWREENRLFASMSEQLASVKQTMVTGVPTTQMRQLATKFTWLEQVGRLRGECLYSLIEREERFGRGTATAPSEAQRVDPGIRYGKQISIVSKRVFEADRAGHLRALEETPAVSTITERPPPPSGEALR